MMDKSNERRGVRRLHFNWPVWFAEDFRGVLSQGQMVDVSRGGLAFTCSAERGHPNPGQWITIRFSVPRFGPDDAFGMANFIRSSRICQVDTTKTFLKRIAVQFADPLPFDPQEQAYSNIQDTASV